MSWCISVEETQGGSSGESSTGAQPSEPVDNSGDQPGSNYLPDNYNSPTSGVGSPTSSSLPADGELPTDTNSPDDEVPPTSDGLPVAEGPPTSDGLPVAEGPPSTDGTQNMSGSWVLVEDR